MPVFTRTIIVCDLNRTRFFELEAVIDTGSSNSQIPQEAADYLGLTPEGTREVMLADGTVGEQPYTSARLALANVGNLYAMPVLIGQPGSAPLIGTTALEIFGFGVDTGGERLIPKVWQLLAETRWPTL